MAKHRRVWPILTKRSYEHWSAKTGLKWHGGMNSITVFKANLCPLWGFSAKCLIHQYWGLPWKMYNLCLSNLS